MMKKCSPNVGCGKTKSVEEFSKNRTNKDGYFHKCKACMTNYHSTKHKQKLAKRAPGFEADIDASWMTGADEVSLDGIWN